MSARAGRLATACEQVVAAVAGSPRYAHTSHLLVDVAGERVFDAHLRGPHRADVFSVTKSVLGTLVGCAAAAGRLPPLDDPVSEVLPVLVGTPSAGDTWRQLLTMSRGSVTGGAWDIDAVTALPGGQVAHIAAAPKLEQPGLRFRYDNGAAHLLSAALAATVEQPVAAYAQDVLFGPLGIAPPAWLADPDGHHFGYAHLQLSAGDLARLAHLWLAGGRHGGVQLVDPTYWAAMSAPQTAGGPPEHLPYGYLMWVDDGVLMASGWAGQHVLVLPQAHAVVVTTGEPGFRFGPPPSDALPRDWRPALELVREHVLPVLLAPSDND